MTWSFCKFVSSDILTSSLSAMKTLFSNNKHSLIHDLSKCLEGATPRPDAIWLVGLKTKFALNGSFQKVIRTLASRAHEKFFQNSWYIV